MFSRRISPTAKPRNRGFALLITITLLAFLVLLLVSLASLTRVETQVASNGQQLASARQNALLALNVALGQLQKAAGPDQRVTATAEVLSTTKPSKKKWTGVWDTRTANLADIPVWLVSQADPAVASRTDTDAPVLAPTVNSNDTAVRLVGNQSTDTDTSVAGNAGNEIIVPLQTIKSDIIPGATAGTTVGRFGYWVGDEGVKARINLSDPYVSKTDTLSLLNRLGTAQRTAWELFSGSTSPTPAATDPKTVITSDMTAGAGRMLNAQQIKLLASVDTSAPSGAADALTKVSTARFHDYTLWSAGVQADVKNGGLKWDLSTAFDLSDALFATSEFSLKAQQVRDSSNAVQSPVLSYTNASITAPTVSFVFFPKVLFPGSSTATYLRGPTWHLLRSHYQLYQTQNPLASPTPLIARSIYPGGRRSTLGGQNNIPSLFEINSAYGGGAAVDPNINKTINGTSQLVPRVTQSSVAPYINRIFIRFGVKTVQKHVTTSANPAGVDVWAVQLIMTPFVVLHNPYNTDVQFKSYSKKSSPGPDATPNIAAQINLFAATSRGLPLATRVIVDGHDYMTNGNAFNSGAGNGLLSLGANSNNDDWPRFKLLIPETVSLKAGELKVLYPQGASDLVISKGPPDTTYVTLNTTPNLQGGFVFSLLNGQRKTQQGDGAYLSEFNAGNNEVNPPLVATGATIAPNTARTNAEFTADLSSAGPGSATEIWANSATSQIQVIMNTLGGNFEIKYSIESVDPISPISSPTPDDATTSNTDGSSMAYQLDAVAPPYVKTGSASGLDTYLAQYTNYSKVAAPGFSRADDYKRPATPLAAGICTTPKYFFGMDFYVKPADHPAAKAARPFITSNPVAFVQFSTALGNQTTTPANGTSGFPKIMPAYQLDFLDLDPATAGNLSDNMYIDGNGNAIWGPHNGGDGAATSSLDGASTGLPILPLINIPSRPLTSLAELQHANIATFGYQPYFAVGNSYASPYVKAASAVNPVGYSGPSPSANGPNPSNPYFLYDLSYLMNDALWDKYFFSSLSQELNGAWNNTDTTLSASIQNWATGNRTLPNSRIVPYNSTTTGRTAADNLATVQTAYRQVAASSLTTGSFNINSRSIDAWAAVLGAARGVNVVNNGSGTTTQISGGTDPNAATAIPRMIPSSVRSNNNNPLDQDTWKGFTTLTDTQIRQLAKNIVAEITRRQNGTTYNHNGTILPTTTSYTGPFRSLSDFINRNLVNDLSNTSTSTGAKGALQAALDEPTNSDSPNYRFFSGATFRDVKDAQNDSNWRVNWGGGSDFLAGQGPTTSTASGFILQADVLQQIGPFLSARSDTFTIRTFGESINPATGESAGKAWCEAIVQRLPEYVDQSDADIKTNSAFGMPFYDATPPYSLSATGISTTKLSSINQNFGRRFKIVSFRWLSSQDI